MMKKSLITAFAVLAHLILGGLGVAQSGSNVEVSQKVIATGGGSSSGSSFTVEGTVGQPGAGTLTRNPPYSQVGGFWAASGANQPTAAPGEISGRIVTNVGESVPGVVVILSGGFSLRAITDRNGRYSFTDLPSGDFYTLVPAWPNFTFSPPSRSFSLLGNVTEATFTAVPDSVATLNPLDTPEYFVRQQYLDFLNREPDLPGFNYWSQRINDCHGDAACVRTRRIDVSAAFFIEREFQQTGSFIYRVYKAALGRQLSYLEFSSDRQQLVGGPSLDISKTTFTAAFVQRTEFLEKYQTNIARLRCCAQ